MDEAARRFSTVDNPGGIIASMDADAIVDASYLEALVTHFTSVGQGSPGTGPDGCSVYFEHPLYPDQASSGSESHETYSPEVYQAIAQYELHLRYYINAVRSTGYPYAYHTVGSAFAVRADVYCMEGGMNRRQGGEDFYFIQKVAQRGKWSECNTTRVVPSPRPSDRVPFGTGPVVARLIENAERGDPAELTTYHPEPFRMLRSLFSDLDRHGSDPDPGPEPEGQPPVLEGQPTVLEGQPPVLARFLEQQGFSEALAEIRANSATPKAFRKRFWRWFNMFRIMKFLHFARENGYGDVDVAQAAFELIKQVLIDNGDFPRDASEVVPLLVALRKIDR
jgi:hypothetical protein